MALLLLADRSAARGGSGLDWDCLKGSQSTSEGRQGQLTWGELRARVQAWIASGGPKARDRNPFVCFRDGGYFGRAFDAEQLATTRHLEAYCVYTSASLLAHQRDLKHQRIRREYNSKGFYRMIMMVNYLAHQYIVCLSPS